MEEEETLPPRDIFTLIQSIYEQVEHQYSTGILLEVEEEETLPPRDIFTLIQSIYEQEEHQYSTGILLEEETLSHPVKAPQDLTVNYIWTNKAQKGGVRRNPVSCT